MSSHASIRWNEGSHRLKYLELYLGVSSSLHGLKLFRSAGAISCRILNTHSVSTRGGAATLVRTFPRRILRILDPPVSTIVYGVEHEHAGSLSSGVLTHDMQIRCRVQCLHTRCWQSTFLASSDRSNRCSLGMGRRNRNLLISPWVPRSFRKTCHSNRRILRAGRAPSRYPFSRCRER